VSRRSAGRHPDRLKFSSCLPASVQRGRRICMPSPTAPREVRPRRKRADLARRTGSRAQIQSVLGARSGSAACSGPVGVGAVRRPRSRVRPAILWRGVRFSLTWFSACAHVGFWFLSGVAGATLAEKKCWYVVIRGRCACVCTSGPCKGCALAHHEWYVGNNKSARHPIRVEKRLAE